ncbi:MAG TPA: KUP/HAK/KT family potassium transporter [Solirubrobacteraceae bacterium]
MARRRSLHEAAHKLDYVPPRRAPIDGVGNGALAVPPEFVRDDNRDVVAAGGRLVLALGALGVVYGDIGTSPLYTEQVIFTSNRAAAHATIPGVYGVVSLIFWSLMIVVTIKYAGVIMRAHNRGDGGIMALTALIRRSRMMRVGLLVTLGIFGAALFFGDGMITPAISVLSAVQGLNVVTPSLGHLVVPISLGILVGLFLIQRRGTGAVGWLFGPVLLVWFGCLGVLGATEVVKHPGVLQALSPVWGARFMIDHGVAGVLTLGSVVLAVTGAEALYADRGHFGAFPIRLSWLLLVFGALVLNYLGQGALILHHPGAIANPFLLMVPHGLRLPMVLLATVATIIASQAVITGSFSVARQAVQLGFLPRLKILHTSKVEGQIYVPIVNWILAVGVIGLVLLFRNSNRLADMYGVAVTGTFVLNTILFLAIARSLWKMPWWKLAPIGALFLVVELSFFGSNLAKIAHGAWLPLVVGIVISVVMLSWRRGQEVVTRKRTAQEGSLQEFLARLTREQNPVERVPGTAVFLSPGKETTPLALRYQVDRAGVLQDKVVIVTLDPVGVPHVEPADRFVVMLLGSGRFKVIHVTVRVGYSDGSDVPAALALARKRGLLERNLDLEHASYFLSRIHIVGTDDPTMPRWRQRIFLAMARNAASPVEHFGLPGGRTVEVGSQLGL